LKRPRGAFSRLARGERIERAKNLFDGWAVHHGLANLLPSDPSLLVYDHDRRNGDIPTLLSDAVSHGDLQIHIAQQGKPDAQVLGQLDRLFAAVHADGCQ